MEPQTTAPEDPRVVPKPGRDAAATRPLRELWGPLRIGLIADLVTNAVVGLASARAILVFPGAARRGETLALDVDLAFVLVLGGAVLFVVDSICMFLFGRYTYRAMKNLHLVRAAGLTISPGWSVGWHLIPFANFWMPFKAMQEIWRGSFDPARAAVDVPPVLDWWWGGWIIGNVLSNVSTRLTLTHEPFGALRFEAAHYVTSLWLDVAAAAAAIVCAATALDFLPQIAKAQDRFDPS